MKKGEKIKVNVFDINTILTLVHTVFNRYMWYLEKAGQFVENSSIYSGLDVATKAYEMKKLELVMKGYTQNV